MGTNDDSIDGTMLNQADRVFYAILDIFKWKKTRVLNMIFSESGAINQQQFETNVNLVTSGMFTNDRH